jgi:shikimate 5-dehydrogenase
MGYPVEKIDKDTVLHGYVGVNAMEDEKFVLFNNYLKELDYNIMMMPLNIREDDIGFFLNGFKDSKIKSAYFAKEYWQKLYELLEFCNDEVKICGMCDTVDVKEGKNMGSIMYGKACAALIGENKTIAIYGNSAISKTILFNIAQTSQKEIILADMVVENTLEMDNLIPKSIPSDIQRVEVDKLIADVVVDSTNDTLKIDDKVYEYEDILDKIAEIKTKEWGNNG